MKCPLIIAGPGVPAGRSTAAFTYLFDLFPTICDLAGGEAAGRARRREPPAALGRRRRTRRSATPSSCPFSGLMRSVRDERWKLIVYPPINHRQLFDLQDDPHETHDLAADPAHAAGDRAPDRPDEGLAEEGRRQAAARRSKDPKPKEVRFDDFERKPDQWQPAWIVEKYFRGR